MSGQEIAALLLLIIIFLDFFYALLKTYMVVVHIKQYKGRVVGKIVNIRNESYYYRLFKKVNDYFLTFQYVVDGVVYESEFPHSYGKNDRRVGQEIILHYDLNNPQKYVPGEEKLWKEAVIRWILIIVSCLFFLFIM